jgi:hypothetical protein
MVVASQDRGLLARLDALVDLAANGHLLALLPDGRPSVAEAQVAVRASGLPGSSGRPVIRVRAARDECDIATWAVLVRLSRAMQVMS